MKLVTKGGLAFCWLLLSYFPAYSQYRIQHFTTENGLPSNGIKGLQLDEKTGFLWIATEAGLVRYNGMSFKTFDIISNPELGSNRIVFALKNASGKILVAGEEGNLLVVKENIATTYYKDDAGARNNFNHYCAITASDYLFRKCYKNPWPRYKFTVFKNTAIPISDSLCAVWAKGCLYYYDVSTQQPLHIIAAGTHIKTTFKIGNDLYYADSLNKLFSFDVYKRKSRQQGAIDSKGRPFQIQKKNSNLFWQVGMKWPVLIQQGKAWLIEKENDQKLRLSMIASGIPENSFLNYVQYNENSKYLFLGTASKGMYVIRQNQLIVKQPRETDINQNNSFYSQIELPNGNILTSEGRVIGDNPSQNNFNIGNSFLNNVYPLNDTVIIFGRRDSLFAYNKKTFRKQLILKTRTRDNYAFAFPGKQPYFANQNGIGIIQKNGSIDLVKSFDGKTSVRLHPFTMLEISPGKLALATCDGLLRFDTNTKIIDTLLKLPAICIRSLYKEGDYIFIGTYGGGFYVMKNNRIKAMPLDINGYLKYTHCFVKDDNGFCWVSTNNGLFKVKMSDITDAYEKDLQQIYYHYLGKNDGMETTEMNGGCTPCALRLKNRDLSFPTMDGMLWFNPEKLNINLPRGAIYIDKIGMDGKQGSITGNDVVQIPEHVDKIDITLVADTWCKKENLYIEYKLNNDKWGRVDLVADEPRISFANLSYGTNVLRIRKLNGFGINNYSDLIIKLSVATPFYHWWWFRILAGLTFVACGYLLLRLRLKQYEIKEKKLSALVEQKTMDLNLKNIQLEKNDQVKTRLIAVINHDIIAPLRFMHYAGKTLLHNNGMIEKAQRFQTIAQITQTAKDMEMLSSQILNWIIYQNPHERMQKEAFDLHQLVDTVFGVLQFPANLNNTKLQNDVPANLVVYQLKEPLRVLIYNLVLNSINFTREGLARVQCNLNNDQIVLMVADTGIGMTKQQIENLMSDDMIIASTNVYNKKGTGLGYMIIKDLLKIMEGYLYVSSSKNGGTTVSVYLSGT